MSVNLTVLFYDCVPSRIYLALLSKHGIRPKKLINVRTVPTHPQYKSLARFVGNRCALFIFLLAGFVKRKLSSENDGNGLIELFMDDFGISKSCLETHPSRYVDIYSEIYVSGFNDPRLSDFLDKEEIKCFLFTGGGILKEGVLNITGAKFIHIHPGIVPDIKGADCFFWSCLIKGNPGYSIFYMRPEIDTGDILYTKEYNFTYPTNKYHFFSNNHIYDAILKVYDPALRILTFIDMINNSLEDEENIDFSNIECVQQNHEDGRTYFFMHEALRNHVINKLKNDK